MQKPPPASFLDRLDAAEIEAHELHSSSRSHRAEAEVGQEVAREDRWSRKRSKIDSPSG